MDYRVSIWAGDKYYPRAEFEAESDARLFVEQITSCRHKLSRMRDSREVEILAVWENGVELPVVLNLGD